jgi:hypothetical protein
MTTARNASCGNGPHAAEREAAGDVTFADQTICELLVAKHNMRAVLYKIPYTGLPAPL